MSRRCQSGFDHPHPGDITPQAVYDSRRTLLRTLAAGAAGGALAAWAGRQALAAAPATGLAPLPGAKSQVPGAVTMERATDWGDATSYNNFYEFGTDKADPARHAHRLQTRPWTVRIDGLVNKPGPLALEDLLRLAPMEERIYRLRCVEGWSMVIPWVGYSLDALIRHVQPLGSAKYVAFFTLADARQMPGLRSRVIDWPYTEALRLDEARHPLALLAFGMYGQVLPNQNGAPVRLVVPWKYGFKSAKSIVAIRFLEQRPVTSWMKSAPSEYGFYANVNPQVDHPRWSQASERRIGEDGLLSRKRPTAMFNGYAAQVGHLYAGMDLRQNY
ncbi:MAG: protein-methionine-sulfoxide reductase catalytic subunit MsrP [Pseudomonadota bacterium]|nr:protein-methionine-sulfoxide reductase catalytic subunit MsrP [Pseudomonadota bacterium]